MRVRLKPGEAKHYYDLSPAKTYVVLGIEADDLRIVNDQGRPYLYPPGIFEMVDPGEPGDWVSVLGESGERYAYPQEFSAPGFFEDYFDHVQDAVETFDRYIKRSTGRNSR